MGPGPRFEPESQDPQSRRITAYPTPAFVTNKIKNLKLNIKIYNDYIKTIKIMVL